MMRLAKPALLLAACLALSACNRGILDPVGPVGQAEKTILINSTAIMLAIVIPTMLATVAFAWWFRRGNSKATYLPDWEYSGAIEMVVWAIPAADHHAARRHHLDRQPRPRAEQAARIRPSSRSTVEVVSLDWKWLFIYPDQGIATVNQLVVPAGTPVNLPADVGDRLERLLRPAIRDDDLHHAADDDPAEPAGRPAGRL